MKIAKISPSESERLKELAEFEIWHTPQESTFDEIVKLASIICGTPIALVSLVNDSQQWFKAKIGLSINETDRDISFCSHALDNDDLLIIEDATKDERFCDNPMVIGEPFIKFYAGMPLVSNKGLVIGTLCVKDQVPRQLTEIQKNSLRILGRQVMTQMELMRKILNKESQYLSLFHHSINGIYILNQDSEIIKWNQRATEIFGWTAPEAVGKKMLDLLIPERFRDKASTKFQEMYQQAMEGVHPPLEVIYGKTKSGKEIIVEFGISVIEYEYQNLLVAFVKDVTDRIKNHQSLIDLNQQLKSTQLLAKVGYWELCIADESKDYWSDEMYLICGRDPSSPILSSQEFNMAVAEANRQELMKNFEKCVNEKQPFRQIFKFQKPDGSWVDFITDAKPWYTKKGVFVGLSGVTQDITELVRQQEETKNATIFKNAIIDYFPGILFVVSKEGKFIRWNQNLESVIANQLQSPMNAINVTDIFDVTDLATIQNYLFRIQQGKILVVNDILHIIHPSKINTPYFFTAVNFEYRGEPSMLCIGINYKIQQEAKDRIEKNEKQLQEMVAYMHHIREVERKRIGRELHDELGQQLTSIKMDLSWMNKRMGSLPAEMGKKMEEAIAMTDLSNQSLRRILNDLRPTILDENGLYEALQWLTKNLINQTGIKVDFICSETVFKLPEQITNCAYRVFQEAITNIIRYSKADKVSALVWLTSDNLHITIEDNGIGFDVEQIQKTERKSFGLLGMEERVKSLQGSFRIHSSPGKGTKIQLTLPVF